jgi:hypothetical protein
MPLVRRGSKGTFEVVLMPVEADALLGLPARLRQVLGDPDFSDRVVRRLFPPTYGDPELEAEHRRLLGDDLIRRKLEGVEEFEKTLERRRPGPRGIVVTIEERQFDLWLAFLNDMRILLGTELDIQDDSWQAEFDPRHPRAADMALYAYLTWLEAELIEAA